MPKPGHIVSYIPTNACAKFHRDCLSTAYSTPLYLKRLGPKLAYLGGDGVTEVAWPLLSRICPCQQMNSMGSRVSPQYTSITDGRTDAITIAKCRSLG